MSIEKKSIELFLYDLIAIIDKGYTETIEEIEKQIDENNIGQYILDKYKEITMLSLGDAKNNIIINDRINCINKAFWDSLSYISGNESRKLGIDNKENGLLLLVATGIMIMGDI